MSTKENEKRKFIRDRIKKGKSAIAAVHGLGSVDIPTSVKVKNKIYWSVAVPSITYGLEVMELDQTIFNELDDEHWKISKQIQNLPLQTPNPAVLPTVGWISLSSYIDIMRLLFLWRVLCLDHWNAHKQLMIYRIAKLSRCNLSTKLGPVAMLVDVARKYDLFTIILNAINENGYMSLNQWKVIVKSKVKAFDWQRHLVTLPMYKNLELYKVTITRPRMWAWWEYSSKVPVNARKCNIMLRMMVQPLYLMFQDITEQGKCELCNQNSTCTLTHIFFECPAEYDENRLLWAQVLHVLPETIVTHLQNLNYTEIIAYIFCGMHTPCNEQNIVLYDVFIDYIWKKYMMRKKM
jgi:hypothetical protein